MAVSPRACRPTPGPVGDKALPGGSGGRGGSGREGRARLEELAGQDRWPPWPQVGPSHQTGRLPPCQAGGRRLSQKTVLLAESSWR